jgi:hypothetical protein
MFRPTLSPEKGFWLLLAVVALALLCWGSLRCTASDRVFDDLAGDSGEASS